MALNTRSSVDPRWVTHHSPVEDGLTLAYIEIFKPNNSDKQYDPITNTWTTDSTVLYKGWARIQPNRPFTTFDSSNDFVPASAKDVAVFFNIHKNDIIHRDIKPGNIFVKNDILRIVDFDISKWSNTDEKMTTGMGTDLFVAPEVDKSGGMYD